MTEHTVHKYDANGTGRIRLVPLADLHIGSPQYDDTEITSILRGVYDDPNAAIIIGGDMIDNATPDCKTGNANQTMTRNQQIAAAVQLFQPIAQQGKILAVLCGNHEFRSVQSGDGDPAKMIAEQLGVTYAPASVLIYLITDNVTYTIYAIHGGLSKTDAGIGCRIDKMVAQSQRVPADLYLSGHSHIPAATRCATYSVIDAACSAELRERVFVNTASALAHSDSYADMAGYLPTSKIYPEVYLDTRQRRIRVLM